MISSSSSLASVTPATSEKVTRFWSGVSRRALDLPKDIALVPPLCIWRKNRNHSPTRISSGAQDKSAVRKRPSDGFSTSMTTWLLWRSLTRSG